MRCSASFAVGALVFLLLSGIPGPALHRVPVGSGVVPAVVSPAHRTPAVSLYLIAGHVARFDGEALPPGGVRVGLVSQSCTGAPSPASCPALGNTTTDATGNFQFTASNGSYYVYSVNTSTLGGDWDPVVVAGAGALVGMTVFPRIGYGNATEVLPGWNSLYQYASNCNQATPCKNGLYGEQVPVLAWTQDGAFYVNASLDLVFYSFVNRTVTDIAPWVPLYQNLMSYDGIENTEWATADGSLVFEAGCWSACKANSVVAVYAVNTTTHQTFLHNFTSFNDGALQSNGQIDLIGRDGNHSIAAFQEASGTVVGYNFWNQTEWRLGTLAYFEANNDYWVPSLNSYIDVEAEGSSLDRIKQYLLVGSGAGTGLEAVFNGTYDTHYTSNGVDGLYLNLTSHTIVVSESSVPSNISTQVFGWNSAGRLFGPITRDTDYDLGAWPNATVPPNSYSSEHRPMLSDADPMVMGFWDGFFDNNSWLYEPNANEFFSTNVTMAEPRWSVSTYPQNALQPSAVEGLFFNSTYAILESSIDCRHPGGSCPINGTDGRSAAGTVWWTWRMGAPEYPFPANSALAEPLPPGPVPVEASSLSNSVTLDWSPPATGNHPILNYTVFWRDGPSAAWQSADLPSGARTTTVTNLSADTNVSYAVVAWNLHWHGSGGNGTIATLPPPPLVASFGADPSTVHIATPFTLSTTLTNGNGSA
ncbi:MAG TPA: fibronectin type III domain-containing protein, partial [Thermoplasmata archaeon]|nr:fibronectin type III domain-containing protein [Thermoplasmata archaeon]